MTDQSYYGKLRNDFLRGVVKQLRNRRIELRFTQEELNYRLGIADHLISKWENGIRSPTGFHLHCWADALGCELTIKVVANDNNPAAKVIKTPANDNKTERKKCCCSSK